MGIYAGKPGSLSISQVARDLFMIPLTGNKASALCEETRRVMDKGNLIHNPQ
jgi:hypothetical protein